MTPPSDGAHRPIRTAIVGFGTSGRVFHAPLLAALPQFSLDAIVTSDADRRGQAARQYPGARLVADVDALLSEASEWDLVVVGSPPASHAAIAIAALDVGLHVVIDKPFCVSTAEGRAVIAAAEQRGRMLTVFNNRRWDADFLTAQRVIAAGQLGEAQRMESRFEVWAPSPRDSWKARTTAAQGGGVLYDLGAHLIDQALRLLGPAEIAYVEQRVRRVAAPAPDDVFVALQHDRGAISHLWMNTMAPQPGTRLRLQGSRAGFSADKLDAQEAQLRAGLAIADPAFGRLEAQHAWATVGAGSETRRVPLERGDYPAFYRAVARCIREGAPIPVDPSDALRTIEIIESAQERASLR